MKFLFCIPSLVLQDEKQCRIELRVWKSLIQINNLRYNRFNIFYSRGAFCLKALEVFLYGAQSSIFGGNGYLIKNNFWAHLPPSTYWPLRPPHDLSGCSTRVWSPLPLRIWNPSLLATFYKLLKFPLRINIGSLCTSSFLVFSPCNHNRFPSSFAFATDISVSPLNNASDNYWAVLFRVSAGNGACC